MYPDEFEVKDTKERNTFVSNLDLLLLIVRDVQLHNFIYGKRKDFIFPYHTFRSEVVIFHLRRSTACHLGDNTICQGLHLI